MKKLLFLIIVIILPNTVMASPILSSDGKGDFLIAPAFFANGTFKTNLEVVNTNSTSSIILYVVIRDSANAEEVSFPILLTPNDVWNASISEQEDRVYIQSYDNSNYIPQIATEKGLDLTNTNTNAVNGFQAGFIEFYPIAQYNEVLTLAYKFMDYIA